MRQYLILAAGVILLPMLYCGTLLVYQPSFEEEANRKRRFLKTGPELAVMAAAEAAYVRIWQAGAQGGGFGMEFQLLFLMLAAMTVFCMTDLWEQTVPNRILAVTVLFFVIAAGMQGVRDMDVLLRALPSVLLGFLFSAVSFGLGYLLSRGSMGAGDVKLALVMGLCLTGRYVVGAVLYGCIAAALYCVVQLARKRITGKDKIPFVPFLYLGMIIRLLAG